MLELKDVTLVAPTGKNIDTTIKAIMYSMRDIKFSSVKLITHEKPDNLPIDVEFSESFYKMDSYVKYNQYVFEELYRHVETPYCLLVQYDGFVINSNYWTDEFLNYDYLGAPWAFSDSSYITDDGEHVRVGNGGFTLRTKKLLELPKKYNIPFQERQGYWNEDGNICVYNRRAFQEHGIKYAPIELACKFSKETPIVENTNVQSFGFHSFSGDKYKYRSVIE